MSMFKRGVEFLMVVLALAAIAFGATAAEVAKEGTDLTLAAHRWVGSGDGIAVSGPVQPVGPAIQPKRSAEAYGPNAIEYYLSTELIYYIRPGYKINLVSITNVGPSKKPIAEVLITDDFDQPLDRNGKVTPGTCSISFVLDHWTPELREYFPYTTKTSDGRKNPSADQGGKFTDLEVGHYKYEFGTTLPANFDVTKTLTLGIYGKRDTDDIIGKNYFAPNTFLDFRADGNAPVQTWAAMDEATSCNNCHNPLEFHGDTRRDTKMCVLCHNSNTSLSVEGNSIDFKVMIHKIHRGANLPSVQAGHPYIVAGHDYSNLMHPQDIRNCWNCHEGTGSTKPPEANIWYTRPSSKACGACHDDVNFTTGANHPAGPASDASCKACHIPQGELEFDASIRGAHTIPADSTQLKGLKAEILTLENTGPGQQVKATFKVTNGDGSIVDPTKLNAASILIGGETATDYSKYIRQSVLSTAVFNGTTATYTFTTALPADAKGTWTASGDFYRNVNIKRGDGGADISVREAATNPLKDFAVTGGIVARRVLVDIAKCNKCHDRLALHGEQRLTTGECAICHNPTNSDIAQRPADQLPEESIDLKRLIHRIHTGDDLTQDFTVYGNNKSLHNFNEVRFPGDRRDCLTCHTDEAAYSLPAGTLSTTTKRDYFTPMGPATTSCTGCHDTQDAAAHAYVNTAPFGESCATCHGPDRDFSATKVHAR